MEDEPAARLPWRRPKKEPPPSVPTKEGPTPSTAPPGGQIRLPICLRGLPPEARAPVRGYVITN